MPEIINGIVTGLANGASQVWDAACELGSNILNGIKDFLGINSPSTVMAEQGGYIVDGLINGLATLPDQVAQVFSEILADLQEWGADMATKAQKAITDMGTKISNVPYPPFPKPEGTRSCSGASRCSATPRPQ